jgi:ABC-2 type transport system permease protein
MCGAALAYGPAVLFVLAVAVAVVAFVPRAATAVWVIVVWAVFVAWFGELLNLPAWARNLSPIGHTPLVPYDGVRATPLIVLGVAALALVVVAVVGFRRRDVTA